MKSKQKLINRFEYRFLNKLHIHHSLDLRTAVAQRLHNGGDLIHCKYVCYKLLWIDHTCFDQIGAHREIKRRSCEGSAQLQLFKVKRIGVEGDHRNRRCRTL